MPINLHEPIARAIQQALQTYLPAQLRQVEIDNALAVQALPDVAEYTLGVRQNHMAYPALELDAVDALVVEDMTTAHKRATRIDLVLWITDGDEANLTLKAWRYEVALVRTILQQRGGFGFGCDLQGQTVQYTVTKLPQANLFMRDIELPLVCTKEDVL